MSVHLFEGSDLSHQGPGRTATPCLRPPTPARSVVVSWNQERPPGTTTRAFLDLRWSGGGRAEVLVAARGPGTPGAPVLPPGLRLAGDEVVVQAGSLEEVSVAIDAPGAPRPRRIGVAFWPSFAPVALPEAPVLAPGLPGRICQYDLPTPEGHRMCGPSSLAMALAGLGRPVDPLEVAAAVHDPWAGIYGNWTQLAALAGELGLAAWVERGGGPVRLAEHLSRGRVSILSLRWEEHELPGAPIPQSDGHLVLAVGVGPEGATVLDPAFRDPARGTTVYPWPGLLRAWRSGASVVVGPDPLLPAPA